MHQVTDGVYQIYGFPPHLINMYLIGDVLLDAGIRADRRRILRGLRGHTVNAHALTHVHPDHQGATHAICEALDLPLWCPAGEVAAMESGDMSEQVPKMWLTQIQEWLWAGPAHPVARGLREGDVVGGFTVIDTPGHSPGHIAYFREHDRVLIAGDAARNIDYFTLRPGLAEPPEIFTTDVGQNRQSLHQLAALRPSLVMFGHGRPVDGAAFVDWVASLP